MSAQASGHNPALPLVLAGPILRALTPNSITLWLATSAAVAIKLKLQPEGAAAITLDAKALSQDCGTVAAGGNLGSNRWRGASVLVQRDHHEKAPGARIERPSRSSTNWRIASRAASNGYLLGSMQSSGMRHLALPAFSRAWKEIKEKSSSFQELRRFDLEGASSDPKNWK